MKSYQLAPDAPAELAGEWLHENGWTLADVLEWYAGKPCCVIDGGTTQLWPPAKYGRDVLVAFILAGGATHPRHVKMAESIAGIVLPQYSGATQFLHMKRHILGLFSGPAEINRLPDPG